MSWCCPAICQLPSDRYFEQLAHSDCRLVKEPDTAAEAAAAATEEDAADEDDEEDVDEPALVAERTVDRQILDAILRAGTHRYMVSDCRSDR